MCLFAIVCMSKMSDSSGFMSRENTHIHTHVHLVYEIRGFRGMDDFNVCVVFPWHSRVVSQRPEWPQDKETERERKQVCRRWRKKRKEKGKVGAKKTTTNIGLKRKVVKWLIGSVQGAGMGEHRREVEGKRTSYHWVQSAAATNASQTFILWCVRPQIQMQWAGMLILT